MSEQIERNRQLIALHQARKVLEEAERLLKVLPQGEGSTLDADLIDGLHAAEIIARAVAQASKKITQKYKVSGGGASGFSVSDLSAASISDLGTKDHDLLDGLTDDDHTQYALLAGRAGGQTLIGGTGSGDDLTLQSTSHATKGSIFVGNLIPHSHNAYLLGWKGGGVWWQQAAILTYYLGSGIQGEATNLYVKTYGSAAGNIRFYSYDTAFRSAMQLIGGYVNIERAGDITMLTDKKVDCNTNGGELHPARVSASAQPTPSVSELQVWRDPDDNKTYLIYNDTNEGVRSVELT